MIRVFVRIVQEVGVGYVRSSRRVVKKHRKRKHPNKHIRSNFRFVLFQLRLETEPNIGASDITLPSGWPTRLW